MGETNGAAWLLDQPIRSVRDISSIVRGKHLVVAEEPFRSRLALSRAQNRLVVGSRGTALSSGEVGQGYREVADPSVYVRFPLEDHPGVSLVVWTTTPWTLPSNQFAAVNPTLTYAYCTDGESEEQLIIAEPLVATIGEKLKKNLQVVKTVSGVDLIGLHYKPPFDYYYGKRRQQTGKLLDGNSQRHAWRIVGADFVTIDSGTGAVHIAPAFGEVDYELLVSEQARFVKGQSPSLICAVDSEGKFTDDAPEYKGVWVKDADKTITRRLREEGTLVHQEQYVHDYPFCWRAESDPLIQYPRESWFISTTKFRDAMLKNNSQIGWMPDHIRDGRFGNFLASNVDWALSRERYWGTPLPIWVCEETGWMEAISSYDELLAKPGCEGTDVWEKAKKANPDLVDDLKVHKPYIDAVTYQSPKSKTAKMRRVTEVIDCWYDSGAMPFAQWGYPHKNADKFQDQFPADFISEAIDQTRGWFYSQLAISTMLFSDSDSETATKAGSTVVSSLVQKSVSSPVSGKQTLPGGLTLEYPHPFKNCIVLGLMLAEWYESKDGKQRFLTEEDAKEACGKDYVSKTGKMSKQLRNYRSPQEIFNRFGADALRWYFYANQPPWNSILYSERAIRDSIPEFMLRLWNVFSFFTIYAEIDGFAGPGGLTKGLDQLVSSELSGAKNYRPVGERSELDRWVISELNAAIADVATKMDAYDSYGACQTISNLVEGLSNWFVRRSRSRYWAADKTSQDKIDAYWTLYECLVSITKMIAPFVPFLAESLWQHLTKPVQGSVRESVHLCDFPVADPSAIDRNLGEQMALLREIASLGRSARMDAKLKVRQPLARVEVTLADNKHQGWLEQHDDIVREELNVKEIHYTTGSSPYIEYSVQPNFRRLGPRVGPDLPKVKAALAKADGATLLKEMTSTGAIQLQLDGKSLALDGEDISVRLQAKSGWAAAQGKACVVVLATELTESLILEGIARDFIRAIQDLRKTRQCRFADRIEVLIAVMDEQIRKAITSNQQFIAGETLAVQLKLVDSMPDGVEGLSTEVADATVVLGLRVVDDQ